MARRRLPAQKTCTVCGAIWTPKDRYQAARGKTCGPKCAAALQSRSRKGRFRRPRVPCATCGKPCIQRPPSKQKKRISSVSYCSRRCWGRTRGDHLRSISASGLSAITPDSRKRAADAIRGPKNPAWRGGATYRKSHGNYSGAKYIRCPQSLLPMARRDGYVMEHRAIIAMAAGRILFDERLFITSTTTP